MVPHGEERIVEAVSLGERLRTLRLREAAALETMRRSLERHGQLTALTVFSQDGRLEVIDGFKRLQAARALGWGELCVRLRDVDGAGAKILIAALHERRGLTELEEAWLVRSLYREDGLSQSAIAHRLERHKSWVCRRLMLVESLDAAVQADVRLGLIAPRAAVALAALPRGNQAPASAVVVRRGLTVRQTELLVVQLLERPDDAARAEWIARRLESTPAPLGARPARALRSEAEWMAADIATLLRVSARLQSRLLGTPLGALGTPAAEVVFDGLVALAPVLDALRTTVAMVTGTKERAA